VISSRLSTLATSAARCEGEFRPPAPEGSYIKPKILVDCLVQMFYRGVKDISKKMCIAMRREMENKRCDDGSRCFSEPEERP
jgi:hypothetical protein